MAKANEMPGDEVVVKAQVLAGGRGLGYFKERQNPKGVEDHTLKKDTYLDQKLLGPVKSDRT